MGHGDKPRDSCGGTRGCGGNLLVVGTAAKPESFARRNLRAAADVLTAFRTSRRAPRKGA